MARYEVESEVDGSVWKVLIEEGQTVASGQVLIILESMKMEIPVESPGDGIVADVLVQPEDQVEEDQVLVVVESP